MFKFFILLLWPLILLGQFTNPSAVVNSSGLDTLEAGDQYLYGDTIEIRDNQIGGFSLYGHTKKLTGDNKSMTIYAVMYFNDAATDSSNLKTVGTEAITTTATSYSYSLANLTWYGVCKKLKIIYYIPTGGTMPGIEVKGKALIK